MRSIRYFAALLLILTGVLHALPFFNLPKDPNTLSMMAFGIVYFTIGILLILNLKISPTLGIIFPLIGLGTGVFMIGFKNWGMMLTLLFAIDAVVILCCSILFFSKPK